MELRETLDFKKQFHHHRDRTGDWLSGGGGGVRDFEFLGWVAGGSWVILMNWGIQESSKFRREKDVCSFGNGEFQVSGVSRWKCFPSSWLTQLGDRGERREGGRERERAKRGRNY